MEKKASNQPDHSCTLDKIISLCKRRGFVYQASEIYGGLNGAYDYGAMDLVSFSHGKYYRMKPEALGFFGYSIMKPKTAKKRAAAGRSGKTAGRRSRKTSGK